MPLLALAFLGLAAAEPACPASAAALEARIQAALDAYAVMDTDRFFAAEREARQALGCLDALLEPEGVAAFHGVTGLAAWLTEDEDAAAAAFEAALAARPDWRLPESVAPAGSPLLELTAQAAQREPAPVVPMAATPGFHLVVDGEPSLERPGARPCVLQVADSDWGVLWSGALDPGDPLPQAALDPARFARGSSALAQVLGDAGGYERETGQRLAWGSAALGASSLGLFAAAGISGAIRTARQKACIEDAACVAQEDAWTESMDGLHGRAVGFAWSGAACAAAAAGLGLGAVLERRF